MQKNKILAIIPARGGSKRIPKKNIKPFLGKPIIKYSIDAALQAKCFDEIMVSTDDKEIADISIKYNAKVPFLRSNKNSDDQATTADVMKEVLLEYKKQGKEYDYVFCLYPTAPFITAEKLKNALKIIEKNNADAVVSITRSNYPIQRSLKINKDGKVAMIWPENMKIRSQDLMPVYHDAGQYFCIRVKTLLDGGETFTENTLPIVTPESEVQDIDNKEDWKIAEIKFSLLKRSEKK